MSDTTAWATTIIFLVALAAYNLWRWYSDRQFYRNVEATLQRLEAMQAEYEAEGRALAQAATGTGAEGGEG